MGKDYYDPQQYYEARRLNVNDVKVGKGTTTLDALRSAHPWLAEMLDQYEANARRREMDLAGAHREIARLRQQRDELRQTLDLTWEADQRAIAAWQQANPGNELVWPDRAELTTWLLERADKAERELGETNDALAACRAEAGGRIRTLEARLAEAEATRCAPIDVEIVGYPRATVRPAEAETDRAAVGGADCRRLVLRPDRRQAEVRLGPGRWVRVRAWATRTDLSPECP